MGAEARPRPPLAASGSVAGVDAESSPVAIQRRAGSVSRLPGRVRLPGGYEITVTLEPRPGKHLSEDDDASYDTDEQRITLWEGLTPRQRWRRFSHEMLHAVADYAHWIETQKT